MQVFFPLCVAPGMLMHRRGLRMKNFNAISVPSYIFLTEVFASSASIFYTFLMFPYFKILQ